MDFMGVALLISRNVIATRRSAQRLTLRGRYNLFMIKYNGQVGINLDLNDPNNNFLQDVSYKLAVNGKIICEELRVQKSQDWPDYVFEKDYRLMPLDSLKNFITTHKHLPDVPDAESINNNGINVSEMNTILLKKIEELMLYVIELNEKLNNCNSK
jgi:hypothetical protein